mmetsp:Transcript_19041/g.44606  ORF Transcript_19041/g.44606 Transcript_19041/m.44606 type:complete len:184 (-) Transcript_19041:727-1278(-)
MGGSHQQPPPASVLFLVYTGLAFLIVFLFGKKDPSNQDFVQELAPVVVVTCGFLVSYELLDVMAVGAAKLKTKCYDPPRSSDEINQEEVYLAQRVQTNQVEQISPFLIGSYSCALLVDGKVAGVLAMFWVILRRAYAVTYRASIGIPVSKAGLAKFTVPCYFILNAMLMSSVIQSARMMIVGM